VYREDPVAVRRRQLRQMKHWVRSAPTLAVRFGNRLRYAVSSG